MAKPWTPELTENLLEWRKTKSRRKLSEEIGISADRIRRMEEKLILEEEKDFDRRTRWLK